MQNVENEEQSMEHQIWKRIWDAKVPNKIRVFTWRLCHEIIPVFDNLFKRKMDVQPLCPLCKQDAEKTMHAIRDCPIATEVWQRSSLHTLWTCNDENQMLNWFIKVSKGRDERSFEFGMVIIWVIYGTQVLSYGVCFGLTTSVMLRHEIEKLSFHIYV